MRRGFGFVIFALCVAFAIGSISNVVIDNADVVKMALVVACPGAAGACGAQVTRMERSPFGQSFDIATKTGTQLVTCRRALVLFGDYACAKP